jgi:hypothetical protein
MYSLLIDLLVILEIIESKDNSFFLFFYEIVYIFGDYMNCETVFIHDFEKY